jgi:chitodextrinase
MGAASAALVAWLVGPVAPAAAVEPEACTVDEKLVNSCRAWFGATANEYVAVDNTRLEELLHFEERVGRQMDVAHTYNGVGDNRLEKVDRHFATRADTYLFNNWALTDDWSSADGSDETVNAAIDEMAASVKALGEKKMFLTLSHEPEPDVSVMPPGCGERAAVGTSGTVEDYKAMWANVRSRFDAAGVTNAVWAMNYMGHEGWDCLVDDLYPGDHLVDWIVFNGYQHGNSSPSFEENVGAFYDLLESTPDAPDRTFTSKPWGIVEWGIHNSSQQNAYRYYAQAKRAVETNRFPRLGMYLVFDSGNWVTGDFSHRVGFDRSGKPDPLEQQAFNHYAQSPALGGTGPAGDQPPGVASDVSVALTEDGAARLTWSAAPDDAAAVSYNVLRDGTLLANVDALGFVDRTVEQGRDYVYTLRAKDGIGNASTELSSPVSLTVPDMTAPTVPTGVDVRSVGGDAVLSWSAATDNVAVIGYDVRRDDVPLGTTTGSSFTDESVVEGLDYSYTVRAHDAAGNVGGWSEAVSLAVQDTTAPTAPTDVSVTLVDGHPRVTWTSAGDNVAVASYDVLRDGVTLATLTGLDHTDVSAQEGSTYAYTVRATDTSGNVGAQSAPVTATLPAPDRTAPSRPTGFTVTLVGGRPRLSWTRSTDNVGVTGYDVLRDGSVIATPSTGPYVDSTAPQGRSHTYQVRARDAAGNVSALSASISRTVPDTTAPSAPALTAVRNGTRATLTWTPSTDNVAVTGYIVQRGTTQLVRVNRSTTRYVATGLRSGTRYTFRVIAVDRAGNRSVAASIVA